MTANTNKSMFWKVGMILASYYVAVIPASFIFGTILLVIFIRSGHSLADIQNASGDFSSYLYMLFILVVGLLGIRYGVRYVIRKSLLNQNDVYKIITWFIVVDLFFIGFSVFRGTPITYYPFVVLIINCLAIFFFSKNPIAEPKSN